MLLSELEERERRFTLALRAGIPVLLLIGLILSTVLRQEESIKFLTDNILLIVGIVFITIYFIYFLLDEHIEKTLIDQATACFNQKTLLERLKKNRPQTLSLLSIKNLSTINANYGIEEIDTVLHMIIEKLNDTLEAQTLQRALIGKHYGSAFIIAVDGSKEHVEEMLQQFTQKYKSVNDIEIDYGFAVSVEHEESVEKTILYLKDRIYTKEEQNAKSKEPSLAEEELTIADLEADIVNALNQKQFLFNFRPLLNTQSNISDIYEVAVTLNSSSEGKILPRVYLPIINRLGLGRKYDLEIVKYLIDFLPLIDDNISLTFNLSPFSLRDKSFQIQLFDHLEKSGLEPSRLIIELYERKTHHNLKGYLKTLNGIRAKGIRICIDNFGSSNASMEYMKHFKFDMVQFDRDFVTHLGDKTSQAMLESLIRMSKELQITTVAKWVDKERQKEILKALGIDYLQGFGVGKPLSETKLLEQYN